MTDTADYVAHGWALCLIDSGSKAPRYRGWNTREGAIRDADIASVADGIGLLHAYSGTCAIDLDDLTLAIPWCIEHGIPISQLREAPDSVHVISGMPSRDKLLYKLPTALATVQPRGSGLEFRCATSDGKSVQDVLPPTIHPITHRPYVWRGDWRKLPPLPATIYAQWRAELVAAPPPRHHDDAAPDPGTDRLEALVRGQDPDCGYTQWSAIGMALHKATRGASHGFKIWNDWSKTGKKYPGPEKLQTHWVSFRADKPNAIGVEYLEAHSAATPDEFENIAPKTAAPLTTKESTALLAKKLVYVEGLGQYYDLDAGVYRLTDHDLYHTYANMFPPRRNGRVDVAKALAECRSRQSVNGAAFHPGEGLIYTDDDGRSYLNGYKADNIPLLEPTADEREIIEWLFNRIDDEAFREWLRRFYAHMMQRPGIKIRSAPIFHSEIEGNGKTTMMSRIPRLLAGSGYSQEISWSEIEDRFSGFLRGKWHICMTELKVGSRKDADAVMARIKPWITDAHIGVRAMRTDAINIPNHLIITATSNKKDALLLGPTDRRFGVYELKAAPMTPAEVQRVIVGFLESSRAPGAVRHYFQHIPLGDFNPNMPPPRTAAHDAMVEMSQPEEQQVIRALFEEEKGAFQKDCGSIEDVQVELRSRLGWNPGRNKVRDALQSIGAVRRHLVPRDRPVKRIWIWRNYSLWLNATYEDIFSYLDEIG